MPVPYVDEIKMYNRQLSQEEIANMYWQCEQFNNVNNSTLDWKIYTIDEKRVVN